MRLKLFVKNLRVLILRKESGQLFAYYYPPLNPVSGTSGVITADTQANSVTIAKNKTTFT